QALAEGELELPQEDAVAVLQRGLDHGHAVHRRAVLGLEVQDAGPVLVHDDLGVLAGDPEVLEDDLAFRGTSDHHLADAEGVVLGAVAVLIDQPIHRDPWDGTARPEGTIVYSLLRLRNINSSTASRGGLPWYSTASICRAMGISIPA